MTRLMWTWYAVVWISPAAACAADRGLEAAKIQYVRNLETVRAAYLESLASEVDLYAAAGNLDGVEALRTHRGEFLLGLTSAETFRQEQAEHITSALHDALDAYVTVFEENRTAVEAAYAPAIEAALAMNDVGKATRLRQELELFQSAEYGPSAMEVDSRNRAFDLRRLVAEGIKLAAPLSDDRAPDELNVSFQAQRFRISGTYRHDVSRFAGDIVGHFGKAVLFEPERSRTVDHHGFVWTGVREQTASYAIIVVAGNRFEPLISLKGLEVGTVYEWSVNSDRRELVFEVQKDGAVLESVRLVGNSRTVFGFAAIGRYPGNKSDLRVAID